MKKTAVRALVGALLWSVSASAALAQYVSAQALASRSGPASPLVAQYSTTAPSVHATSTATNGATAWSTADLPTGALRGQIASNGTGSAGYFSVSFGDSFRFAIPGATDLTRTRVYLQISFDANLSGGELSMISGTSHAHGAGGIQQTRGDIVFATGRADALQQNKVDAEGVSGGALAFQRTGDVFSGSTRQVLALDLFGANPLLGISSTVTGNTYAGAGGFIDFGNSAHFRFVTPQGVTYASTSGLGGLSRVGAVPEPSTWALLILGFGVVGWGMRSHRRRANIAFA